jgi:hypothetical protein
MEADVLISEGVLARVYIVFQTKEDQIKTAEVAMIGKKY